MKNKHLPQIVLLFLILITGSCKNKVEKKDQNKNSEIKFNLPADFTLEELYHPSANGQGSWVAMAKGPEDIIFACDQYGKIYSFKAPETGQQLNKNDIVPLAIEIGNAHGLLWFNNGLLVSVNKRWDENEDYGSGIYQLEDSDQDGILDKKSLLLKLNGEGEHGPHSLILSPDAKEIYLIAGNHTEIPEIIKANSRLPINWGEDQLYAPYLDARGHANDIKAPGGWIAKFKPEKSEWELVSAGYRNPFDLAFNTDGELFTYDSDMEWDIGMPWYRPTRICHVTNGSEYGWRTGSGKWPDYYADNLPAVLNMAQGSPTAVLSTTSLKLPPKYKNGLFAMDWSFGTMYFVDLKPKGSTYEGQKEVFLSGTPLPLTDMIAGNDGKLYFTTGGRHLDSHLYRLTYNGTTETLTTSENNTDALKMRELRHRLEAYQKNPKAEGIQLAWTNLNSEDRFISYASRMVLEHASFKNWKNRYLKEKNNEKIITASIALARMDHNENQDIILNKLADIPFESLTEAYQLALLRAYSLSFIRLGKPDSNQKMVLAKKLNTYFPQPNTRINRELGQLLLYLDADGITEKLVQQLEQHTQENTVGENVTLLDKETTLRSEQYGEVIREVVANMPPSEAIYYGVLLSHATEGWNKKLREAYFLWFYDALASKGGMSFKAYMEDVRQHAMQNVPVNEREYFEKLSGNYTPTDIAANLPQPYGPGKTYASAAIQDIIWDEEIKGGTYADGKRAYEAAMCVLCHSIRGEGGASGPDLTQVHSKFGDYDLVMAIYSPNDEISDQYANTLFRLKDGTVLTGRIKSENEKEVALMPNPFNTTYVVKINKENIKERKISPVSPMPGGLLNRLNDQEIKDLFRYLKSGGDPNHELFQKQ